MAQVRLQIAEAQSEAVQMTAFPVASEGSAGITRGELSLSSFLVTKDILVSEMISNVQAQGSDIDSAVVGIYEVFEGSDTLRLLGKTDVVANIWESAGLVTHTLQSPVVLKQHKQYVTATLFQSSTSFAGPSLTGRGLVSSLIAVYRRSGIICGSLITAETDLPDTVDIGDLVGGSGTLMVWYELR